MHNWTFIGLGDWLTVCGKKSAIPQSCTFSQQAGYIIDAVITTNFLILMLAAVWFWRPHRNLVVMGSVLTTGILGLAAFLVKTGPDLALGGLLRCVCVLVLAPVSAA